MVSCGTAKISQAETTAESSIVSCGFYFDLIGRCNHDILVSLTNQQMSIVGPISTFGPNKT